MDPQSIKNPDGTKSPYGPIRFKEIIKERYLISKNLHTSYNDVGKITPAERTQLIQLLAEDIQNQKKLIEESRNKKD